MEFVWFALIGMAAGWRARAHPKGSGFGWPANLVVGVLGALLGGFVFRIVGFQAVGLLAQLIVATVGAVLLLALLRAMPKAKG